MLMKPRLKVQLQQEPRPFGLLVLLENIFNDTSFVQKLVSPSLHTKSRGADIFLKTHYIPGLSLAPGDSAVRILGSLCLLTTAF